MFGTICKGYNAPLASGRTRTVVAEPQLTPGSLQDPNYVAVIQNTHTSLVPSGNRVAVYINMSFGSVTEATIEAEIALAVSLYFSAGTTLSIDDIFFDQAPGTQASYTGSVPASYKTYLTDIITYATGTAFGSGATYWLNTGFYPDEFVMNVVPGVNTAFVLENNYASWSTVDVPDATLNLWVYNYNGNRIASIVHDSTAGNMYTGTVLANSINSHTVYFTDGTGSTEYQQLPSYWPAELTQVNGGC